MNVEFHCFVVRAPFVNSLQGRRGALIIPRDTDTVRNACQLSVRNKYRMNQLFPFICFCKGSGTLTSAFTSFHAMNAAKIKK